MFAVWRFIGEGVLNTLRMVAVAAVFAIVIGVLFSFGRAAASRWIRIPVTVVLEFFRGMPVLLMMLFILLVFATGAVLGGRLRRWLSTTARSSARRCVPASSRCRRGSEKPDCRSG